MTASVGNNATFSCEADVGTLGCEINVMFLVKRNGMIMPLSDGQYNRYSFNIICFINKRDKIVEFRFMVFNATFNNISVISWRSVLLMEETGENH